MPTWSIIRDDTGHPVVIQRNNDDGSTTSGVINGSLRPEFDAWNSQQKPPLSLDIIPPIVDPKIAIEAAAVDAIQTTWSGLPIKGQSPDEIANSLQLEIDELKDIDQIKAFLKTWIPTLTSAFAWTIMKDQQT